MNEECRGSELVCRLLRSAISDSSERKIGLEAERIGIWPDGEPFRYKDCPKHPGAQTLLKALSERYGWQLVENSAGQALGLKTPMGNVSLEPGSQVEFATNPEPTLERALDNINRFESMVDAITEAWGLSWLCVGLNPYSSAEDVDVIPLPRYKIMTKYLGKRGTLGTSMMRLSASVQINLDYMNEAEGIEMLRAALLGAPISYALFANSPIFQGKNSQYLSFRNQIWKNTDPDRTGLFPEVFEKDFDFLSYAKFAYNNPLMFFQTDEGEFIPSEGRSLCDVMAGKVSGVGLSDYNQLSGLGQLFMEARIKPGYVEVRSVDGQCQKFRGTAAAFWMGVLYLPEARQTILDTFGRLSFHQRDELLEISAKDGLKTHFNGIALKRVAEELFRLAKKSLLQRGRNEERFLEPIEAILETERAPAHKVIEDFASAKSTATSIQKISEEVSP